MPTTYTTRPVITTSYSHRQGIEFIASQALDFLMTEDNDYLITNESIYTKFTVRPII